MDIKDVKQTKANKEYQDYANQIAPKSKVMQNSVKAFLVGGFICTIGELLNNVAKNYYDLSQQDAASTTSIILIFTAALLTGLGLYEKIGKWAGAGAFVPITGFSNSVVSPAMEFKREGYILGVGAKLFSIAGPVLVYGIGSSVVVGLINYFFVK